MRSLLLRQLPQGREVLRALLVDRMTFTPVITAGTRGYRFLGQGSYGGLLTGRTWPTTIGGPNGIRTRVSVTTTFSPAVSDGSYPHAPSERDATKTCRAKFPETFLSWPLLQIRDQATAEHFGAPSAEIIFYLGHCRPGMHA